MAESAIPIIVANPDSDSPQQLEGMAVSTGAGPNLFRQGIVISDPSDDNGRAPVHSTFGLAVQITSSVPQPIGALTISTMPNVTIAAMPVVTITTYAFGLGVSSMVGHPVTQSSGPWSINGGVNVSSITAALGVSSMTAASFPGLNVTSHPAAVGVSSLPNVVLGASTGSLSVASLVSLATTNSTVAKASPGQFFGYSISNAAATAVWLRVINASSAVQVSSAPTILRAMCNASTTMNNLFQFALPCSTGIYYALTALAANNDNTAIGASTCAVSIYYV